MSDYLRPHGVRLAHFRGLSGLALAAALPEMHSDAPKSIRESEAVSITERLTAQGIWWCSGEPEEAALLLPAKWQIRFQQLRDRKSDRLPTLQDCGDNVWCKA